MCCLASIVFCVDVSAVSSLACFSAQDVVRATVRKLGSSSAIVTALIRLRYFDECVFHLNAEAMLCPAIQSCPRAAARRYEEDSHAREGEGEDWLNAKRN
jgi:hypothetical protein